jgi:hypothetical protein
MSPVSTNEQEMLIYKDIVESFFENHYPAIEKEDFWKWFILTLTGIDKKLDELEPEELGAFLNKLKEIGDGLFDPKCYERRME